MRRAILSAGLLVAVTAMLLALTRPAAGQLPDAVHDDIVVGNADAIRTESVLPNSSLNSTLDTVATRLVVEFANAVRAPAFAAPSNPLATLLDQVAVRIPVEFANGIRHLVLGAPPSALSLQLDGIAPRLVMEFANANRETALSYPIQLINDVIPPLISQPSRNGAKISWITSEFTRSTFRYGTNANQLTETVVLLDYAKVHEVTVPTLTPGATVYSQITATDLSGNQTVTPVYQVAGELRLYLPAIRR